MDRILNGARLQSFEQSFAVRDCVDSWYLNALSRQPIIVLMPNYLTVLIRVAHSRARNDQCCRSFRGSSL